MFHNPITHDSIAAPLCSRLVTAAARVDGLALPWLQLLLPAPINRVDVARICSELGLPG